MVNNLMSRVEKGMKKMSKIAPALGLSAFLAITGCLSKGCKSPGGTDLPDVLPVASLSVSPSSGTAPLETRIVLEGTPQNNLAKYILRISTDENQTNSNVQSYGIDQNVPIIEGDYEGERISREVGTDEKVDVLRNSEVQTESSVKNYERGKFREREMRNEIRTREQRQDYERKDVELERRIGFVNPYLGFNSESKENVQPHRIFVLGNDVLIEELESMYPINITRVYDNVRESDVKIYLSGEVIDTKGRKSSLVRREVVVRPRGDVSIEGILRCNETNSAVRGKIKVFDKNRNLLETDKSDSEGYVLTDSNGNFNFRIKRIASESDEILIRAAHGIPGNRQGWIRTMNLPARDSSGLIIVGVPYGISRANPDEFRDFMYDITGSDNSGYLRLFDYENFDKGFVIIRENLDDEIDKGKPEGKGKFSNEQIEYIKNILTPFKQNVDKAVNKSDYKISVKETSENYIGRVNGVVHIIPSTAPGGNSTYGGLCSPYGTNGLNQGAEIYLRDNSTTSEHGLQRITLHEIGHLLYSHTINQNSVMAHPGTNRYSTFDLKGFKIIYEENFRREDWVYGDETGPLHHLRDILGKDFNNWD